MLTVGRGVALAVVLAMGGSLGLASPAHAQSGIEPRVDKLEREMRAVQRKVFPAGGAPTIEPQITAPPSTDLPGAPSGSPITDLSQRVTALESGLSTLTGQIEQAQFRQRQADEAFTAYKTATDARLRALEQGAPAAPIGGDGGGIGGEISEEVPATTTRPSSGSSASAAVDPARAALVRGVQRPDSGDAGDDSYTYGYRLWQARLYPEAQAELKTFMQRFPRHRRASFAQNLLGRAYLDEGKPSLASIAFYDNFKTLPEGERAPDSLYYLAQALMKLNKPADACKVYAELTEGYGERISATMTADVARGRAAAKCR